MGEKDFRVRKGLVVDGTGDSTIAGRLAIGGDTGSNALRVTRDTTTSAAAHGEVAQLLVKPSATSGQDALLKIIGARNASTSTNTATLVLANRDDNATGGGSETEYGQLGAIVGRVSDATNNIGDMHFITYADAQTPSDRMVIKSNGFVGIGTTDPNSRLEIRHPDGTTVDNTNNLSDFSLFLKNPTVTTDAFAGIAFDVSTETDADSISASIVAARSSSGSNTAGNHEANLIFSTNSDADDDNFERMRISYHGRVGINEDSPQAGKLHIKHNDTTTFGSTNQMIDYALLLKNETVSTNRFVGIAFDVSTETDQDSIGASIAAVRDTSAGGTAGFHDTNLVFSTNNAGDDGNTERMRIHHDGPIEFNGAYKFPTSDGSANQVLQTNGSGTLSFATVSSGGSGATALNGLTDVLISDNSIIMNNFGSAPTTGTLSSADTNVVIGYLASDALTEGDDNVALGAFSLTELTTGSKNVAVGRHAGAGITTTSGSVHLGYQAGIYQTGSSNIGIGNEALTGPNSGTVDGAGHIAIGFQAGAATTTGDRNILIGYQAGDNLTTGGGNVIIGNADASAVDVNDSLIIAGGNSDLSSPITWLTGTSGGSLTTKTTTTIGDGAGGTSMVLGNQRSILFGTGGDSLIAPISVSGANTAGKSLSIYGGNSTGNAAGGVIKFITAAAGGASNSNVNTHLERMRIDADGKVGIGTDSPADLLEIQGTNAVMRLDASASGSGVAWVKFDDQGTSKWALGLSKNASLSGADFHIYEDAGSANPRVTVKDGGRVGIGTTAPDQKLHVEGSILADAYNFATTTLASDYTDGDTSLVLTSSAQFATAGSGTINGVKFTWTANDTSTNTLTVPDLDDDYTTGVTVVADTGLFFRDGFENAAQPSVTIYDQANSGASRDDLSLNANSAIRMQLANNAEVLLTDDKLSLTPGNEDVASFVFRNRADLGMFESGYNLQLAAPENVYIQIDSNNNNADTKAFIVQKNANSVGGGTELFRVGEDGNVGIGTTAPSTRLHVAETGTEQLTALTLDNGLATDGGKSVGMDFRVRYASTNIATSYIGFDYYGTKLTSNSHGLIYRSGRAGFAHHHFVADDNTRQMMIADDGEVGIGSSFTHAAQPDAKLHLKGSGGGEKILIEDTGTDSNPALEIKNDAVHWKIQARGGDSDNFRIGEGSNTHVVVDTSGNVGIGTTSPSGVLHVTAADTSAEAFRVDITDTDSTADSTPFVIDGDGRVGIGTASPVSGAALTLNGDGTSYEGLVFQVGGSSKWKMTSDSTSMYVDAQANGLDWTWRLRDGSGNLRPQMRLDGGTGGLIIGNDGSPGTSPGNNSSPGASMNKLQVNVGDDDGVADFNDGILIVNNDAEIADGDVIGGIGFDTRDGNVPSRTTEASAAIVALAAEAQSTGDKGGELTFLTTAIDVDDDTASTERMRITSEGQVGIGLTNPVALVHVKADSSATVQTTAGSANMTIEQDGTGDAALNFLLTGVRRWTMGIDNSDSDKFKIQTGATSLDGTNHVPALTIASNGDTGINQTSPAALLHIKGSENSWDKHIRLENHDTADYGAIVLDSQGMKFRTFTNTHDFYFRDNDNNTLLQIQDGAGIKFNNAYEFPTSDGSANQVLQTDGNGTLSFATVSGGGGGSSGTDMKKFVAIQNTGTGDATTLINVNNTTAQTITWLSEIHKDSIFTHSTSSNPGEITVTSDGTYLIDYSINTENTGGNRFVGHALVYVNGSALNYTLGTSYSRGSGYDDDMVAHWSGVVELSANDVVTVRMKKNDADQTSQVQVQQDGTYISLLKVGGQATNTFVIVGEESDDYISSEAAAGNANGFVMSYGNGAQNTTKSASGSDFGVVIPTGCTLSRIDITFGNKGSETNSSNQTLTVFKNRSASTTTMTYNASGTGGNAFVKSFSSLSGDGLSYAAGDTFNIRATGLAGYTNTQVGPARMTAYFTVD